MGMTYIEFVKTIIPDADDRECDFVLWEHSPFPVVRTPSELQPYIEIYAKNVRKHYLAAQTKKQRVPL
jgi:hypothetical protein